jgi:hypothetical protein
VQPMRQDQAGSRVQPRRTRARWPCCALQGLPQHAVPVATRSGADPHVLPDILVAAARYVIKHRPASRMPEQGGSRRH